ncbi:MAG: hypothetical protein M0002_08180 [Rhodospirillales bacterium]|nr:hypothetical protein [Rhodospirillales bacterium]
MARTGDKIVIVSAVHGLARGGMRHPRAAEYEIGEIGAEALREIAADRALTIMVGRLVGPAELEELIGAPEGKKAKR